MWLYFHLHIWLFGELIHAYLQLLSCSFSVDIQPRFHAVFQDGKMKMTEEESEDENDEEDNEEDDDNEDDVDDNDDKDESGEEDGEESENDEDDAEENEEEEEDNEGLANFTRGHKMLNIIVYLIETFDRKLFKTEY